jgi:hypothetical protein
MTHAELIAAIILECADIAILWDNPSGVARYKKDGRTWCVPYGVGPKSKTDGEGGGGLDLIGIRRADGKFVAIDAKVGRDRLSASQLKFCRWVRLAGGIAGEARSVDEARRLIAGKPLAPDEREGPVGSGDRTRRRGCHTRRRTLLYSHPSPRSSRTGERNIVRPVLLSDFQPRRTRCSTTRLAFVLLRRSSGILTA